MNMASFTKEPKYKVVHDGVTFEYDTASELGRMVAESGCAMPIPYEPIHLEYDEFRDAYIAQREKMSR